MRQIDADKLRETIEDHVTTVSCCPTVDWSMGKTQFKKQCLEDIDAAPTVGGWISVKDMLPETNDEVLTTYLYDDKPHKLYVETASYFDDGEGEGHWHSVWDEFSIGRVRKTTIAWMPMPKPYKPSKEDNDEAD